MQRTRERRMGEEREWSTRAYLNGRHKILGKAQFKFLLGDLKIWIISWFEILCGLRW
jgi:hypothetical protein